MNHWSNSLRIKKIIKLSRALRAITHVTRASSANAIATLFFYNNLYLTSIPSICLSVCCVGVVGEMWLNGLADQSDAHGASHQV